MITVFTFLSFFLQKKIHIVSITLEFARKTNKKYALVAIYVARVSKIDLLCYDLNAD